MRSCDSQDVHVSLKSGFDLHGLHRVVLCDLTTKKAIEAERKLKELMRMPRLARRDPRNRRQYQYWQAKMIDAAGEKEMSIQNLVALRTRSIVAERLGSVNTYSLNLTHGAVGTSTTAPAASDTQLGAEINRVAYASADVSQTASGIIVVSFFWSRASFTNSAVTEFGNFVDGSASANSGRISSHILFASAINKTALKTLTVDSQYTVSG